MKCPDLDCGVLHCHLLLIEVACPLGEQFMATLPGGFNVPRVQRETLSLGGVVGIMDCEMSPPLAVVIPEMMIRILPVDTNRQFGLIHNVLSFQSTSG